jgi:hypothetical protein
MAQAQAAVAAVRKKGSGTAYWQSLYTTATREKIFAAMAAGNPGALNEAIGGAILPGITAGAEATAGAVVDSGAAVADSVQDLTQIAGGLWQALTTPALWMRLAYGLTGAVLIAGGLFLIVRNTPAGQAAGKVASAVPPLKAVKGAAA